MPYKTNYDISRCDGCGEKPPRGAITDLNRAYATAHGWRCPDCARLKRASLARRKATIRRHRTEAAEFRARFEAEPYQNELMILPAAGPLPEEIIETSPGRYALRPPAHRRARA